MTTESVINEIAAERTTALFFGCWGEPGHYFWSPGMRCEYLLSSTPERRPPWGLGIDGSLTPRVDTAQGAALLHHCDGWTALAFHDYAGDRRPGSNSVFLFSETLDFEHALLAAAANFPEIVARVGPIREIERLDRAEGRQ